MTSRICIVDYGMGNLASVRNAFAALGFAPLVTRERDELSAADAIVLPGVGAFGEAMANLAALDLAGPLGEEVLDRGKPFLGICLGMQLIARESFELGRHEGLGWIEGTVEALPASDTLTVPHVGWSELDFDAGDPLFARIGPESCFYFDHSYTLRTDAALVVATADYGAPITAAVRRDNILATQFHPEKSQRTGLRLIANFLDWSPGGA